MRILSQDPPPVLRVSKRNNKNCIKFNLFEFQNCFYLLEVTSSVDFINSKFSGIIINSIIWLEFGRKLGIIIHEGRIFGILANIGGSKINLIGTWWEFQMEMPIKILHGSKSNRIFMFNLCPSGEAYLFNVLEQVHGELIQLQKFILKTMVKKQDQWMIKETTPSSLLHYYYFFTLLFMFCLFFSFSFLSFIASKLFYNSLSFISNK